ncbi:DJ-1/PfpI family protein [Paracoccus binzhouensis]|uniref:DJ-1/PfpI family protein n=1 Tax=Paracoccus binzhouensis TaxID=2796149 RepID=UPI0018EF0E9E|nr:DJ-1/PfpI family protein [Paracoccus binzhouensis]
MRRVMIGILVLLALPLAGLGGWLYSLPPGPAALQPPPVPQAEAQAMLAALKPPKRPRPLIAVVGLNDATETTDYLMPAGVLRRAGIADVVMLATGPGPVRLYPALAALPDATLAEFDARHPEGADYVIVPAMSRDDDPAVIGWLRQQAAGGATVIGICAGAKVVAAAGLLDGRRATTHWYHRQRMLDRSPSITYVPDRRMVIDGRVATTTGITASMPMMLVLVEAIAGRAKAEAVARDLGLAHWDARHANAHASAAFGLTRPFAATVLGNRLAFWKRERMGLELRPGLDEVALALVADAWSRTYRSRAVTFAASTAAVESRNGIRLLPETTAADWPERQPRYGFAGQRPAEALDQALQIIAARHGARTARVVAMQMEYPR